LPLTSPSRDALGGEIVPSATLQIGGRVLLVASGAPPDAEFVLFDPGDIELHATEPGTIREVGYRTRAADAVSRLAAAGLTPAVADEAAAALRSRGARAYARGEAVRCIVERMTAADLFEGARTCASGGAYAGAWLDLESLARDLGSPRAAATMQALHLAAVLAEYAGDDTVVLATAEHVSSRRPGERTFRRPTFADPASLVRTLATLRPRGDDAAVEAMRLPEVVAGLKGRAEQAPTQRERNRLLALAAAVDGRPIPVRGPLADAELWAIESRLSRGDSAGVADALDAIERRRGRGPATAYLRARFALMGGATDPRAIAERASALSTSMGTFHELSLLAAHAWAAAGDVRRARAFARDLVEDASAHDVLRMHAREVLESVGAQSSASHIAAAVPHRPVGAPLGTAPASVDAAPIQPQPILSLPSSVHRSQPPSAAARAFAAAFAPAAATAATAAAHAAAPEPSAPPNDPSLPPIPRAPLPPTGTALSDEPPSRSDEPPSRSDEPPSRSDDESNLRSGTRSSWPAVRPGSRAPPPTPGPRAMPSRRPLPAYRVERAPEGWATMPTPFPFDPEHVETLSLPAGLHGEPPPSDERPRSPSEARLAFTYLARELGRELRLRFGATLRSDVDGLEAAQRYLREVLPDGRVRSADEERDIMRNGAFLSELLARRLGARWADLADEDPGSWSMLIPSRSRSGDAVRVWPFARVLRFIQLGHKERDLVSYYLELEARAS
jgi:hypothetical protein